MKISTANLRRELLPGIDHQTSQQLESAIREFISARELALYRMMSFQLGWVDENGDPSSIPTRPRTHGQFALAVADAFNESSVAKVVPYAVSVELLHNFSLIHEDVEDGNTEHNGRPSVWWTWGPAQAINAGDGMHAMARMALFSLTEQGEAVEAVSSAIRALDEATIMLCEGEYTDIMMQEQIALSTDGYLAMVENRTGALFGASARIAAIASGNPKQSDAMFSFGRLVGAARQLSSDYSLFWGDEELDSVQHGRLLTKKKNLPVVHAVENAPPTIKRRLGEIYMQRVIDPAKLGEISGLLDEAGSREATLTAIKGSLERGQQALDESGLPPSVVECLSSLGAVLAGVEENEGSNSGQ